ncbi:hypothetical protein C0Q70_01291 [Pomacea canaliculata]|uniref:Uncharacterized protein n=1 Tax=Pomacea canaliculata TaxID=400727 RepID=A0A2T7PZ27_POMCA|nr:hypothetical protein C0Q70_01291 [Pomacea canaliculata]
MLKAPTFLHVTTKNNNNLGATPNAHRSACMFIVHSPNRDSQQKPRGGAATPLVAAGGAGH